ncbi:hypothetical protein M0P98_04975 [bacterium]|nr:hypothetical protein [bacterium]
MKNKAGITFIGLIISVLILAIGISTLLKIYPVISTLSEKAKGNISVSFIADKIFALIENVYGNSNGPPVPTHLSGIDEEFPLYFYSVDIKEEKESLYNVDIEISWKKEGKIAKEYFSEKFRRR